MGEDLIHGFHAVLAAIEQQPQHVVNILLDKTRSDKRSQQLIDKAREAHIKMQWVPRAKLDQLAENIKHQGVVARIQTVPRRREKELPDFLAGLKDNPFLLVLDSIQDPHNLGACLRSAAAAGVQAVILPKDRSAPLSATTRKVASGAVESLAIFQVTNLARTLEMLKEKGIWLYGTDADATQSLYDTKFNGPLALVMGREDKGLRKQTRERCDYLLNIPLTGTVKSLNVSVATGICLFEAIRQRAQKNNSV